MKFIPFSGVCDVSFWEKLADLKLNKLKLSTEKIPVKAIISLYPSTAECSTLPCHLSAESFENHDVENCAQVDEANDLTLRRLTGNEMQCNGMVYNVNTLEESDADELNLNEIGHCDVTLTASVPFDSYKLSHGSGAFIIIDRLSNVTVAAGMIIGAIENDELLPVTEEERIARYGQQSFTACLTGENNSQTAHEIERLLFDMGHASIVLDENELAGNISEISSLLNKAGFICLCSLNKESTSKIDNGEIFDCDKDSSHTILNAISNKAKLK